ncbi:hypothetical protein ACLOJK_033364 [Asimina triloba]
MTKRQRQPALPDAPRQRIDQEIFQSCFRFDAEVAIYPTLPCYKLLDFAPTGELLRLPGWVECLLKEIQGIARCNQI